MKTAKEAKDLCKSDPTVRSKVFEIELLGWYGPSDITYRGDPNPPAKAKKQSLRRAGPRRMRRGPALWDRPS